MSTDQVLNETYWGKLEGIYTDIDKNRKFELWTYEIREERNGVTGRAGLLFFIDGKLNDKIPPYGRIVVIPKE